MYRNTDHGDFGDDDRCLADTQLTEVKDNSARFRFRYGATKRHERNATLTFKSAPGQSHKNMFEGRLDGATQGALYDLLFVDCNNCKIMKRHGSNKCVLSVREVALRKYVQHCHFVYDLLCGPETKYPVSDASCLDGAKSG
ncbi:uncharacterized protein LOC144151631 isoform X2 [Haemaphysalis longicornis]